MEGIVIILDEMFVRRDGGGNFVASNGNNSVDRPRGRSPKGLAASLTTESSIMDQPILIWCVIMGILLLTFVFHALEKLRDQRRRPHALHRHHHLVELGKEREMFFIPGDRKDEDCDEPDE